MILVKSYGTLSEEYFFGTPCIIWLLFFFRIVFLDFLKYYSRFFCSFLPMRFSILEHKCEDLTSKNDIFGGSISRKLIALDKYFLVRLTQNLCSTTPTFAGMEKHVLKIDKSLTILERQFYQFSNRTIFDVRHPKLPIFNLFAHNKHWTFFFQMRPKTGIEVKWKVMH